MGRFRDLRDLHDLLVRGSASGKSDIKRLLQRHLMAQEPVDISKPGMMLLNNSCGLVPNMMLLLIYQARAPLSVPRHARASPPPTRASRSQSQHPHAAARPSAKTKRDAAGSNESGRASHPT